ncbi:transporter [Komagataeibacter rhaeticus]|uniref:ABC transporter substrate-binding protein/permease n=1 Tax=Komagataeibacter rhaeticus TaxID=215221 RepID=UPI0004D6FF6E|nr:ABC transporter substrate-binding protein/permease [Komagataeibacter rhaeticus]KDU97627.1 transporter [Komagataeibacter rhaeticus AF1]MBL7241364.1 ABC transporter substrate-binding protein/permease [Komagataeibacter rhaeticus]PYD52307.1 transporter [Komagataeibacter rhaeticus]
MATSMARPARRGPRRMPVLSAALCGVLALAGHARAQAPALPGFIHDGTLTVCTNPTLPPMTFVNGMDVNAVAGIDMDIAHTLAAYWHVPLVITTMEFTGLFPSLAAQRCSMVASGLIRLPAREQNFDAVAYQDTALVIVARAGTKPLASMADLSGRTVAVQAGTSYSARLARENEALAARGRPPIIIQQYPTEDQVVQQVLIGRVFAFASQDVELYYRQEQLHGRVGVILVPPYPEYGHFALYIRKDAHDRALLEQAVATLEQDGRIAAIQKKWAIAPDPARALSQPAPLFRWGVFFAALTSAAFARGAFITLTVAVLSHLTAIMISIPMALALNGRNAMLGLVLKGYVSVFRGAPTLLQLLFIWNALPQFLPIFREGWFTPFLATWISLSINESAYQVEINRAALAAVDRGQELAGDALGLSRRQVYRHVIFPQALRIALPPTMNAFISLLKTTSLASVISLPELLAVTQMEVARTFEFTEYYAAALVYYLGMVFFLLFVQKRIERRFAWADRHRARANEF